MQILLIRQTPPGRFQVFFEDTIREEPLLAWKSRLSFPYYRPRVGALLDSPLGEPFWKARLGRKARCIKAMTETIPLDEAMLCQRCHQIGPAGNGRCSDCGGTAQLNLRLVLERCELGDPGSESIHERLDRIARRVSHGSGWATLVKSL